MRLQVALNHIRNSIRLITLVIMFVAVVIATAAGFAHSYAGLYDWGLAHKLTGWKADTFPLLVDMFILVGELGLFLIALDGLKVRKSITAWMDIMIPSAVIAAGWGASLWFNINHLDGATKDDQVTFAIPPIAAMIGLMILLRTVHRYAARLEGATLAPADVPTTDDAALVEPEPSVPAPTVPAPVVRTWNVVAPGIFRAGTESRAVWPTLAPEPVPMRDSAAPVARPLDASTNGNGVVSVIERVNGVPAWVTDQFQQFKLAAAGSHAQTLTPVPVREATDVSGRATAASSEPSVEPVSTDERHLKGLQYCAEFHMVTNTLPSQRVLAGYLGMKNRKPAGEIINHAKELIDNDTLKDYLPQATHAAG
jgi:uncharacterized protein DUF2637